jgi:glycogen operon protein
LYVILNAFWEPLDFELPAVGIGNDGWRRWIDTSLESPDDIVDWQTARAISRFSYRAEARSVVVLFADADDFRASL